MVLNSISYHKESMNNVLVTQNNRAEGPGKGTAKIRTENVNLYYGDFRALKDISLDIPDRAITAIIGPSGCGKSSLLRLFNRMNDLIPKVRVTGKVELDNISIYDRNMDVVSLRKRVGMVFQRPNPFPMTVFNNVAFGPRHLGSDAAELEDIVERSLRHVALWEEVKDKLRQSALALSVGQQQLMCIARALAVGPDVVLMDEPCSALDPIATLRIEDLMRNLAQDYTIVTVTHNMQQAARISDMAAFMMVGQDKAGTLVEYSSTAQLFTNPKDKRTEDYITGRFG